jgi:hypothetical protein
MPDEDADHQHDAVIDALFASDLAKDVRSEFNARRDEGMSIADATSHVIGVFHHLLERAEEGPVVIIVIAVLQLLEHAPTATFRDAALDLLREGHGFTSRSGEQSSFRRDRERLREQLIDLLESPTNVPDEQ